MPAYNDGEMDEEKDGEKDALAELAHTGQRGRAQDNEGEDRTEQRQKRNKLNVNRRRERKGGGKGEGEGESPEYRREQDTQETENRKSPTLQKRGSRFCFLFSVYSDYVAFIIASRCLSLQARFI